MFSQDEKKLIVQALNAYTDDKRTIESIIKKLDSDAYRNTLKKLIYGMMMSCKEKGNQDAYTVLYKVYQDYKNFKVNDDEALERVGRAVGFTSV